MDWIKIMQESGLAGMFGIAFVLLMFCIVKWVLKFVGDLIKQYNADRENWLKQAANERESWMKVIDRQTEAWNGHTVQAKAFQEMVGEAHKYQREEHLRLEMMQNATCASMKQVEQALGRINGYVKDKG